MAVNPMPFIAFAITVSVIQGLIIGTSVFDPVLSPFEEVEGGEGGFFEGLLTAVDGFVAIVLAIWGFMTLMWGFLTLSLIPGTPVWASIIVGGINTVGIGFSLANLVRGN